MHEMTVSTEIYRYIFIAMMDKPITSSASFKYTLTRSKKNIIIGGVLSFVIITLAFKYMSGLSHEQNQTWLQHTNAEINKTLILSNVLSNIGYGGFIHNFKNAILRLDLSKLSLAEDQVKSTLHSIVNYKQLYANESEFLTNLEETLLRYKEQIKIAERLIKEGKDSGFIDKVIAVDDQLAIKSVKEILTFRKELAQKICNQSQESEQYLHFIIWLTYGVISITLILCFIYIYYSSKSNIHTLNKHNVLFDLAPLAILAIDDKGIVTAANKEAYNVFSAQSGMLINCTVDDLTPDGLKKYRDVFQFPEKNSSMSERGKTLQAKRFNGELFPANISIAAYENDDVQEAIVIIQDMSEFIKSFKDARTDALTGLPNRRDIEANLTRSISISKREGTQLYIALLDIDFFKKVNDDFGHEYGDQVLKRFSTIISESIRESDFVGRWGGEEFLLIIENSTDDGALNICEKIRLSIENHFIQQNKILTVSIGLTRYNKSEKESSMFNRVDKALYLSKENGRNLTTFV
jgi:diguanylate cyclase (GGDEF)-like protein